MGHTLDRLSSVEIVSFSSRLLSVSTKPSIGLRRALFLYFCGQAYQCLVAFYEKIVYEPMGNLPTRFSSAHAEQILKEIEPVVSS